MVKYLCFVAALICLYLGAASPSNTVHEDTKMQTQRHPDAPDALVIRNADRVADEDYPLVGALQRDGKTFCTATVFPQKPCLILTAAHCLRSTENPGIKTVTFRIGDESVELKQSHYAPRNKDKETRPDIAMGELEGSLHLPRKATLSLIKETPSKGTALVGIGFGRTGSRARDKEHEKRAAHFHLGKIERDAFTESMPAFKTTLLYLTPDESKSEFINDSPTLCQGDSGGPIFTKDRTTVVGVVSLGMYYPIPQPLCVRTQGGKLIWYQLRLPNIPFDLLDTLASIYQPSAQPQSFRVARTFCQFLGKNSGVKIEENLRRKLRERFKKVFPSGSNEQAQKYISRYFRRWNRLRDDYEWRLPTVGELEMQTNREAADEGLHLTYWADGETKEGFRQAVLFPRGGVLALPDSPDLCDLAYVSEATSVASYLPWIHGKLDALWCPKPLEETPRRSEERHASLR